MVSWIEQTLAQNPELQATAATVAAARARQSGIGLSIYYPELELEYESTEVDRATAELSQSLARHDKRSGRERVAAGELAVAQGGVAEALDLLYRITGPNDSGDVVLPRAPRHDAAGP